MSSELADDLAIRAIGLSKVYPVYAKPHHRLMQALDPRRGRKWHNEFHALRPLDLAIRRGETVGILSVRDVVRCWTGDGAICPVPASAAVG